MVYWKRIYKPQGELGSVRGYVVRGNADAAAIKVSAAASGFKLPAYVYMYNTNTPATSC